MRNPRIFKFGLIVIVGTLLLSACSTIGPAQSTQRPKMAIADMPDFVQSAPIAVQEAYQFAVTNPRALETVPCYCGCGKMGHKSNLNCYIKDTSTTGKINFDNHAAYCGVCVNITDDVIRLQKEGKSSHDIRVYVDAQYSSFGASTDTAMPAE